MGGLLNVSGNYPLCALVGVHVASEDGNAFARIRRLMRFRIQIPDRESDGVRMGSESPRFGSVGSR